jgi:hypothetical protein
VHTYIVRVWIPDRPGALGQVASRIGALRGDVVGIEILERGGGRAIDELVVTLPSPDVVDLLVAEIGQVDDAAVEEVRPLDGPLPEAGILALEIAARVVEAPAEQRLALFCAELMHLVGAHWVSAVVLASHEQPVAIGEVPSAAWIAAFVEGSNHLPPEAHAEAPHDLAWVVLSQRGIAVALGRSGIAFRARERQQVALLGRLVDALD